MFVIISLATPLLSIAAVPVPAVLGRSPRRELEVSQGLAQGSHVNKLPRVLACQGHFSSRGTTGASIFCCHFSSRSPSSPPVEETRTAALLADRVYPCAVFQVSHSKSYWAVAPFFPGAISEGDTADAAVDELRTKMEIIAGAKVEMGYDHFPDPYSAEGDASLERSLTWTRPMMSADNSAITYSSLTIFPSDGKESKRAKRR